MCYCRGGFALHEWEQWILGDRILHWTKWVPNREYCVLMCIFLVWWVGFSCKIMACIHADVYVIIKRKSWCFTTFGRNQGVVSWITFKLMEIALVNTSSSKLWFHKKYFRSFTKCGCVPSGTNTAHIYIYIYIYIYIISLNGSGVHERLLHLIVYMKAIKLIFDGWDHNVFSRVLCDWNGPNTSLWQTKIGWFCDSDK